MAEKHHCTDLIALLWIFATLMFEQLSLPVPCFHSRSGQINVSFDYVVSHFYFSNSTHFF